jgi:competence protein ComEC
MSIQTYLIRAIKPDLVLISCGRANPYGHPVRQVLSRYEQAGSQVLRTDLSGQVEVITGGSSLHVKRFID